MREENFLGLRADLQVGGEGFGKFSQIFQNFLQFFYNFLENFYNFLENFCDFWKISTIFCDFSENFSENSRSQSVTVQPGSRHYCKFTIKFTLILILILIKILQSTKFEGSHFHNLLQLLIDFHNLSKPYAHFPKLFPSLRSFPFAAVFSRPWLRHAKGTSGRPSPRDGGGMWAIRGIISRITSLIVSRLTSQRPGRKPTKNRGKTKAPLYDLLPPSPSTSSHSPSEKIPNTYKSACTNTYKSTCTKTCKPTHIPPPRFPSRIFFPKKFQILVSILISQPTINLQ